MAEKMYGCGAKQGNKMGKVVEQVKKTETYKSVVALGKAAGTMGGVALYGAIVDSAGMDGSVALLAVPALAYGVYCVGKSVKHAGSTKLVRGFAHAVAKATPKKVKTFVNAAARKIHHKIGEQALEMMKDKDPNSWNSFGGMLFGKAYLAMGKNKGR